MTVYKPLLTQPIEIQDNAYYYRVQYYDGVSYTNVDINPGVFADIIALCKALSVAAGTALGITVNWYLIQSDDDVKIQVSFSSGSYSLPSVGSSLNNILGYIQTTQSATSHTSTYRPSHVWVPRWQNATQDYWHPISQDLVGGQLVKTGEMVGNKTGPDIYYRDVRFVNEPSDNVFEEAVSTALLTGSSARHFHKFVDRAISSAPEEAGNPTTRGLFFWPDWNDAFSTHSCPGGSSGTSTTYEGIQYGTGDRFTFCQFDKRPFSPPRHSAPTGRQYYDIEFTLHTIDAMPTWQAPDQS